MRLPGSPAFRLLPLTFALLAASAHTQAATPGDFPTKPIEVIVPYTAGGGVDAMARAFSKLASEKMGQRWIVTNRDGAGGVVGFSLLANAKPDGYTIAFSPASPLTNAPFINEKMPYTNDKLQAVCQVFENVFAIAVRQESPIKSLQDLLDAAKKNPGGVSYGHAGMASVGHLSMAAIERATDVRFNAIAYRGDNPAMVDVMGGTLDFVAVGVGTLAGSKMRTLAVLSDRRHPALPNIPSVAEAGLPTNSQGLNGLFVPAGTPAPIVASYEKVCEEVANSPAFQDQMKALSQAGRYLNAKDFGALIDNTYKTHQGLVPGLQIGKP